MITAFSTGKLDLIYNSFIRYLVPMFNLYMYDDDDVLDGLNSKPLILKFSDEIR